MESPAMRGPLLQAGRAAAVRDGPRLLRRPYLTAPDSPRLGPMPVLLKLRAFVASTRKFFAGAPQETVVAGLQLARVVKRQLWRVEDGASPPCVPEPPRA